MKNVAVGILVIILSGVLIQPVAEFGVILTEKIQMDSSLGNALAVAKSESLVLEDIRVLDYKIDQSLFINAFIEVYEEGLDLSHFSTVGTRITFTSNSGLRNDIVVDLDFIETIDNERVITTVNASATTAYKLKNEYLIIAKNAGEAIDYDLVSQKTQILKVSN